MASMEEEEEQVLRIMEMGTAMVLPMVLKAALELDLFGIMAKISNSNNPGGARFSSSDLASNLPTQNPQAPIMIERILRFLASQSILTSTTPVTSEINGNAKKLYGMTPICKYLLPSHDNGSLANLLLFNSDKVIVDSWYHLKDAVLEGGIPFNKAHGMGAFEYPKIDKRFSEVFNKAMYDNTRIMMKMILEKYNGFEGVEELVDVGGGLGATLGIIISKYPNIKGINFDLPHVVKDAPPSPGVEHVGGDMFENVPKGDVIFMKWILHDWDDEHCLKVLKNCWAALPEGGGKVVVVESIIFDEQPTDGRTMDVISQRVFHRIDMLMMTVNPGGKERTEKEYKALGKAAGYASSNIVCTTSVSSIMEFYKKI